MNHQKHLICGEVKSTEIETETIKETNIQFATNSVKTWYGDVTYSEAEKRKLSTVPSDTETEYDNYDFEEECKNGKIGYTELANEEVKRVYIHERLNKQVNAVLMQRIIENEEVKITTDRQNGDDIFDKYLENIIDETSKAHFYNWTVKGLLTIGTEDEGSYNNNFGDGLNNDYVYSKYTKSNVKQFDTVSKAYEEILDIGNTTSTANNVDVKLKQFLELLRNKTGEIPENPGDSGGYTGKKEDPSIVVRYDDIYDGTIPAGDLLLDNGALMLFELLESAENTQELVNVFKYLAYLYTGTAYDGVTDLEDLSYILSLNSRTALYGNSIEEKIWFALRNAGISEVAAAAVMGNLYSEGVYKPSNLQDTYEPILGMSDEEYTNAVNSGTYKNFIDDGAGYGLAGWTFPARKKGLYEYTKSKGVGVDDEQAQIEFLITEITGTGSAEGYATCQMNLPNKGYTKDDWKNATSVEEATAAFCYVFERPSIPNLEKRQRMAKQYYNTYKGKEVPTMGNYTGTEGEKLCQAAQKILEHTTKYKYIYSVTVPDYSEGVRSLWNKRGVCCASYVAWILVESGVVSEDYINSLYFRGATTLGEGLKKIFPTVYVSRMADLQKGDIVVWPGHHVQMYAGNGYWYNGGASKSIPPTIYSQYDALSHFSYYGSYYVLRPVQQ